MRKLVLLFVALAAPAWAATPSEGVALSVRRGFFTETDIGGYLNVGGDDGYSNLQTYLQLGVGYDVSEAIELGVHFGLGSIAADCYSGRNGRGDCTLTDNFTLSFIDLTAAYLIRMRDRFYFTPKVAVGYTLLDPPPVLDVKGGLNVGGGVGVEYVTSMDHFSIGFDVLSRFIIGPNILSLQFYPRVKYTF